MALTQVDSTDYTTKFDCIVEKLLVLTKRKKNSETKLINNYLYDLNNLDYRYLTSLNNDTVQLLIEQLCVIITPAETVLIQNFCKLLVNIAQNNIELQEQTFIYCNEWIIEVFKSALPITHNNMLLTLKSLLTNKQFGNINHYLKLLIEDDQLLKKYLNLSHVQWSEIHYSAISCLEGILMSYNSTFIAKELIYIIKDITLDIVSSSLYLNDNKYYHTKILCSCLHILQIITVNEMLPHSIDFMGEILGVVQAFLFYGLKDYPPIKPQLLRPAVMNLPERIHIIPKCKNLKNHKAKVRKLPIKKVGTEVKNNTVPECKGVSLYSSDSDTSDTESNNSVFMDSKVRLESVRLLQVLVENSPSREIFGFWPQIVATGSRNNARVLTRSILKECVSKVKQHMLSTLTELLIDAKPFLMHAEDVHHTSFITFFGTVCLMIKELHFTLCLILNGEKNVAVLTHGLKCAAALVQGTPYTRLKTGLATKLMRNCRPYIFHKDPTVRVAALSVFEAIASCDPVTPEIFEILVKQSAVNIASDQPVNISVSDNTEEDEEGEEEIDIEDLKNNLINEYNNELFKETNICFLIHVCLENISNKTMSTPVRLQSLKLIGRMAFSTGSLVFPHTELITMTLVGIIQDSETQIILHSCRALEIMAGCLMNIDSEDKNVSVFWNIIFDPITSLLQHPQTIIREAACDCLGSINSIIFAQLQRQKAVLIITILFGAVHDKESAVRAAGLRALGMLVTLPALKEETGFLMDLADIVCLSADDKNLGVRIKGAWALANLCNCLSKETNHEEVEPIPLEMLLPQIYQVSIKASKDNDKVKCNAVRALGSILYLCPNKHILKDTSSGLEALINCATVGNDMKVRWNACRALGLVLSNNPDNILQPSWRDQVFPVLCNLICDSPNFKVRTNAAWALYSCNSYGKYIITLWKSLILAFENSQHVPSYIEYPHRDALIQQLCLTLSHVATCTEVSDLQNLWTEISEHVDDVSNYVKQFQEIIVPEKMGDLIKAKSQLEKYMRSASLLEERKIAQVLASIFERTKRYDNLDSVVLT
ncbi:HEAT repeat-containing protein 6 isoform X1 [Bombus huntii]|uniref:HEAT repeat-containing protein 6 isoform X1 n=2 Tax=Bombus huntii TaxID=85661 RepID=UPI0021AA55A7|nr:HEAT repeat-containing protein 6 isoform X1 [Bombus huntii]